MLYSKFHGKNYGTETLFMAPTLKKWGTYWFRLVRVCVCVWGGGGGGGVRYIVRNIFLVFPELSPLVMIGPFDKKRDNIL